MWEMRDTRDARDARDARATGARMHRGVTVTQLMGRETRDAHT